MTVSDTPPIGGESLPSLLEQRQRGSDSEHCMERMDELGGLFAARRGISSLPSSVAKASVIAALFGEDAGQGRIGRYQLRSLLGEGAHGQVFRAFDLELRRWTALKVLRRRGDEGTPHRRDRQLREARALARLSHPNVVRIFDVGFDSGRGIEYLVMELVDGVHLTRWASETDPSAPSVLRVFEAAGRGLAAAHRLGIIHRDFKPSNVLVQPDGSVKVVDFGLAAEGGHTEAQLPSTTEVVGTPLYMAPEQHRGRKLDARADQYAFAITLWSAFVGRVPFESDDPAELARLKIAGPPRSSDAASLPPGLARVLSRALAPDPEARFATMDDLLEALSKVRRRSFLTGRRLIAMTLVIGGVGAWVHDPEPSPCTIPDRAPVWTQRDAAALTRAFEATGLQSGLAIAAHVDAALERYARDWSVAAQRLCALPASRDREHIAACLGRGAAEFATVTTSFRDADARIVGRSREVATSLRPPSDCLELNPQEVTDDPRLDAVLRELGSIHILTQMGRHAEALKRAQSVWEVAATLDARTRVFAGYRLGRLQMLGDQLTRAASTLREAYFVADSLRAAEWAFRSAWALVHVHVELGRFHDAQQWLRSAETALDRQGDAPDLRFMWLEAAAVVATHQGRYHEAIDHHDRALGLVDAPNRRASSLANRALARKALEQYSAAAGDLREALALREELLGPDHPALGSILTNLGVILRAAGDNAGSAAALRRVLQLDEPPAPLRKAIILTTLGLIAFEEDDYESAVAYHHRALALRRDVLGEDNHLVGASFLNLGNAELARGDLELAARHHHRALWIFETVLAPEHPWVAYALTAIGAGARDRGRFADSRAALERALAIRTSRDALGVQAETRRELALTLAASGASRAEVVAMARRAIADYEAAGPGWAADIDRLKRLAF